ncbi:DUF4214 domain-containing protein [Sulfitobacter dubius]|uniref:DUF4214 domain-containing protein n=1 Tax=Sulfitobacter dubius TaxID=218673 RepID=UPI0030DDCFA8
MAQSVIGALRVNLGMDAANFERGVGKAQKHLGSMRKQFVAISGAAAAMGAALTAAALKGASETARVAKSARRLDSSIGGFRALELAAGEAGVSLASVTNDIQTMNRELASIGKSGNGQRALDALGLSMADLAGLDADEKLAAIADRVKALGLSSGETTAILRDLGVRNREMSLLMIQGGDAIRQARKDVADYGLAISSVDAAAIEQANDRIGRLGLISTYAGQQLALALVPSLGAMAQAMTDSLREGGLLRALIDGLANNISEIAGVAIVATTAFGVRYVGAMVASRVATLTFATALKTMKKALIGTGIGALIVGAGVLVGKFIDLVGAAGGFGEALSYLKALAAEVWRRMGQAGQGLYLIIKGVAKGIGAAFIDAFAWIGSKWDALVNGMSGPFNRMMESLGLEARIGASAIGESLGGVADAWRGDAVAAIREGGAALKAAATAPLTALEGLKKVTIETNETAGDLDDTAGDLNDTLEDTGAAGGKAAGGAKKAGKEMEKAKTEAEAFGKALQEAALTSEKLGTEKANILTRGIDSVSNAFGDFVARGFKDFKGFAKSILSSFTGMISQMVALAAKQRIMFSLGIGGGVGGAGAAAAGVPGAAGGGGMLGNLLGLGGGAGGGGVLGSLGTLAGAAGTGFMSAAGGFLSGGLSGGFGAIGAQLSATAAGGFGLSSVAASLGAVAVPVLAIAAAVSFFKKKVTELDKGIRIIGEGTELTLLQFRKLKTSRFWGLSKKVSMELEDLAAETADPLEKTLVGIQQNTIKAAEALGVSADVFDDFVIEIDAALKGLSESEAQAKIEEVIGNFSNNFANMIPGLDAFTTEGENMYQTLLRIVGGLQNVNAVFDQLGFKLLDMSLEGAKASEAFIAIFGSLENLNAAAGAYYEKYYSEAERAAFATDAMRKALAELGIVMPATLEGFRRLVEQAEAMGDLDKVGQLINLAPSFAAVFEANAGLNDAAITAAQSHLTQATTDLRDAFTREMEATRAAWAAKIDDLRDDLTDAQARAQDAKAIADALASALSGRIRPEDSAQRVAQDSALAYLEGLVRDGAIGDRDKLEEALAIVADPSADTYETIEKYRADFNRASAVIRELEKLAGVQLSAEEQMVALLEAQISEAQDLADREIELLELQLEQMIGLNEGLLTLAEAIKEFAKAKAGVDAAVNAGGGGGGDAGGGGLFTGLDDSNTRAVTRLYEEILGRSPDAAGLEFWVDQASDIPIPEIAEYIRNSEEARTGVIPQFANGGDHLGGWRIVGERGPELERTGPSHIVSNNSARNLFDSSGIVGEIRALRAEVAVLRGDARRTAEATGAAARLARKHDFEGLPPVREGSA